MKKLFRDIFFPNLIRAMIFLLVTQAARSAIFSTIITNGPVTNRVNLVFFSEGYTNGQLAKFLTDATNAASTFFSVEPYQEYASYFNVFAIFTNSAHAGSTHLAYVPYANGYTYFNSTYDSVSDYIITIPPNPSDTANSHGQGKIDALLQTYLPATNNDLPALLVNDPATGGSDNYGSTAITSLPNVSYILVHESGHTLGLLGDEYTTAYPGFPTNDVQPNTTTNTIYSKIKWNAWIDTNTPLPTPPTLAYNTTVGLFEGAHYFTTNWYRPYYDCCMNSFGNAVFCPVCQEALVLATYKRCHPIQTLLPTTNSLTVTLPQMLTFSADLLQPTHPLNIQWLTNGVVMGGANNTVLNLWPLQLGNGTNKVEADVWDGTSLVRTDTKNLLKQTNVWTVKVNVPVFQLDSLTWLTNGNLSLRVTGAASEQIVVQLSTNLTQWTPVETSTLSNGKFFYTNAGAKSAPRQYFRAKTPP